MIRLLSNHSVDVCPTHSGKAALEILNEDKDFDIVLSDWSMPEMDGLELLSCVRNREDLRFIYFIMITSKDEMSDKINALNAGADDYITKPCHHEELIARIRSGVRIRALQKELLSMEKRMSILQLATAAGHEINNPLTGVFGYLDLIRDGIESGLERDELINFLDKVSVQTERIRNIVTNLMTIKEIQVKPYLGNQSMIDLHTTNGGNSAKENAPGPIETAPPSL
ncbi:MAG: response regulator [Candidatus Omnitrophica bacterium]|nr:response regulator [Candidatus Omnitrophota bacterium]MCA9436127.1 response regulator [Candidatus Omnitrophota bacterium]MCA9440003.1 response regulator [Candidatus Omnitrophota bacterium]